MNKYNVTITPSDYPATTTRHAMSTIYYVDHAVELSPLDMDGPFDSIEEARECLEIGEDEVLVNKCRSFVEKLEEMHPSAKVRLVEAWARKDPEEGSDDADVIYSVTTET
ncbi:MAG: hypothetical protein EBR82_80325 [Caulobacteraceae bacterium]|nr:hypothetical protein [Caulobacteraceae bacterium]